MSIPTNTNIGSMGPVTNRIMQSFVDKLASAEFRELLAEKIVDPMVGVVNEKIKPYIYISLFMYAILIVLLVMIYRKK